MDGQQIFSAPSLLVTGTLEHYIHFQQGIRFSRQKEQGKESWLSEQGILHSRFRLSISRAVIKELQSESCSIFDCHRKDYEGIERPHWLFPEFIQDSDISFLHGSKEGKGENKGRRLRTRKLGPQDYARYIVDHMYKKLCQVLNRSRRRSCEAFLGSLGYIFVEWAKYPI